MPTSGADVYLMKIVLHLFESWIRSHANPVESEVLCGGQYLLDRNTAVVAPADIVGEVHCSLPAVEIKHLWTAKFKV